MQYSCPDKYGSVIAPWFNQINTFLFGGVTQHGEFAGNVCADLNGMGGGARAFRDGENSMAPFFAAMADIAEQEIVEDDVPFLQLISKRIKRDNQGFGKYRGGMGYEVAVAAKGTPLWGFATVFERVEVPLGSRPVRRLRLPQPTRWRRSRASTSSSKLQDDPSTWSFDFETLMNTQPFPEARYSTHHMGMGFELADEGEVYMICQGSGGGYGDVLDREPEAVLADVAAGYLSPETARDIYLVVVRRGKPRGRRGSHHGRPGRRARGAQGPRRALRRLRGELGNRGTAGAPALLRFLGRRQLRDPRDRMDHARPAARRRAYERTAADFPARPERAGAGRSAGQDRRPRGPAA